MTVPDLSVGAARAGRRGAADAALHPAGGRAAQGGAAPATRARPRCTCSSSRRRRPRVVRLDDRLRVAPTPALMADLKALLGPGCLPTGPERRPRTAAQRNATAAPLLASCGAERADRSPSDGPAQAGAPARRRRHRVAAPSSMRLCAGTLVVDAARPGAARLPRRPQRLRLPGLRPAGDQRLRRAGRRRPARAGPASARTSTTGRFALLQRDAARARGRGRPARRCRCRTPTTTTSCASPGCSASSTSRATPAAACAARSCRRCCTASAPTWSRSTTPASSRPTPRRRDPARHRPLLAGLHGSCSACRCATTCRPRPRPSPRSSGSPPTRAAGHPAAHPRHPRLADRGGVALTLRHGTPGDVRARRPWASPDPRPRGAGTPFGAPPGHGAPADAAVARRPRRAAHRRGHRARRRAGRAAVGGARAPGARSRSTASDVQVLDTYTDGFIAVDAWFLAAVVVAGLVGGVLDLVAGRRPRSGASCSAWSSAAWPRPGSPAASAARSTASTAEQLVAVGRAGPPRARGAAAVDRPRCSAGRSRRCWRSSR